MTTHLTATAGDAIAACDPTLTCPLDTADELAHVTCPACLAEANRSNVADVAAPSWHDRTSRGRDRAALVARTAERNAAAREARLADKQGVIG